MLKKMLAGHADARRGHVVHPVRLPWSAAQPKPTVPRLNELRLRPWFPDARLMLQRVNERSVREEPCGNRSLPIARDSHGLLESLGLIGRQREASPECLRRLLPGAFWTLKTDFYGQLCSGCSAEVDHACPSFEPLVWKDREKLAP